MKKRISRAVLLTLILLSATAYGADKVVVIPLGKTVNIEAPIKWQAQWQEGAAYILGDGLQYAGAAYICTEPHTASIANSPPNDSFWSLMAAQGGKGDKGVTGDSGVQGIQGTQGVQGIKGETGLQGPIGLQGETGPQGLIGATGPQGIQGVQGDIGPQGPAGSLASVDISTYVFELNNYWHSAMVATDLLGENIYMKSVNSQPNSTSMGSAPWTSWTNFGTPNINFKIENVSVNIVNIGTNGWWKGVIIARMTDGNIYMKSVSAQSDNTSIISAPWTSWTNLNSP